MRLQTAIAAALLGIGLSTSTYASAKAPVEWDGLKRVPSKRISLVYLQPGADFRGYSKVMIDQPEVAFHKNWRRNFNSSTRDLGGKVSEDQVRDAVSKGVTAANDVFVAAWTKGGYSVVNEPGPDVLRVRTGILDISVNAPDVRTSSRSYSFSPEAGRATLVVEARDSTTGALLGRAVDQRIAGDTTANWRTSISNRAHFRELVEDWANDSVRGLNELKQISPVN